MVRLLHMTHKTSTMGCCSRGIEVAVLCRTQQQALWICSAFVIRVLQQFVNFLGLNTSLSSRLPSPFQLAQKAFIFLDTLTSTHGYK